MILKKKKMVVLFLFVSSNLFLNSFGQNANISFESECHNVGDTLKLTAKYTGSGSPLLVQWYFSGVPAERFKLQTGNCDLFGSIPVGFPDANRLDYSCSTSENTYILEVTDLQAAEVNASWGATFSPPSGTVPAPVQEPIVECTTPPAPVSDCECCLHCNIPLPGCIFLWILIGVGIACLISAVVILILRFVVGVRFPCGILNCENKKTSPKDSKTGKTKSTAGNTQPPKDEVNEDLVMEDKKETRVDFDKSSAGHTKKSTDLD